VDEERTGPPRTGPVQQKGVQAAGGVRPRAARVYADGAAHGLAGVVRFEWAALDAWFEEDEEVFVHPRSPYTRVDAIRSTRSVRIERDGVVLAESSSPSWFSRPGCPPAIT